MKYDNPKIRDVIDVCVEKILTEPDRALDLKRETEKRHLIQQIEEVTEKHQR